MAMLIQDAQHLLAPQKHREYKHREYGTQGAQTQVRTED